MRRPWLLLAAILVGVGFTAGCGSGSPPTRPTPQPQAAPPAPPPPPPAANAAPVIANLRAQGSRRNEPPNLADADEEITLSALVTDEDTPIERLTFEWSSPAGTFTGTGPSAHWRAPASVPAPFVATLQLRVVDGAQRAERTLAIRVHDHAREVGDMATLFLRDFSDSRVAPATVMRNFLPECYGTREEQQQVEDNRRDFTILSSSVGPARVTVDFDGRCPYNSKAGDACSASAVRWESRKRNGEIEIVEGTDQVAAVYRQDRWWLCDSSFDGRKVFGTGAFFRLLTGRTGSE